jgi:hypothetical protein
MSVHTIDGVHLIISEARWPNRNFVVVLFTNNDAPNFISSIGIPQLYLNHLRITNGHAANIVLVVVHKAITGPTSNFRTLQKQLDWKDWIMAEWIKVDKYDNQNMFGPPCTATVDASIFFWVWLYFINTHDNNRKKVSGVCDGSIRGGQTMVHGASYAPTPQHTYIHL